MQIKSLFHKKSSESTASSPSPPNSSNSNSSKNLTPGTTPSGSVSRSTSPSSNVKKSNTSVANSIQGKTAHSNDDTSPSSFRFGKKRASTMLNLRSGGFTAAAITGTSTTNFNPARNGNGSIMNKKPLERASSMMIHLGNRTNSKASIHDDSDVNKQRPLRKTRSSELHKNKSSAASLASNNKVLGALPSIDSVQRKPTLVYNPYGMNSLPQSASNVNSSSLSPALTTTNTTTDSAKTSRMNSSSSMNTTAIHSNMGTNGYGNGILPLPMSDPNDYLPVVLQEKCMDLYDEYQFPSVTSGKNKKLGDGASASVRTIICKNHVKNSKVYALKKFQMFKRETPDQFYERCSKEYVIASGLSCYPHIVNTSLLVKVPTIQDVTRGWGFVIEYCTKGDLFGLITKPTYKDTVSKSEKFCLFKQVALGLKFLHDNDIVHRDLKPENVLIDKQGVLKITDFGVSVAGHKTPGDLDSDLKLCNSFVGSPPYVPPEVMLFKNATSSVKTDKSKWYDPFKMDMWSLGMIFFVLMYQKTPFQEAVNSDDEYRKFADTYEQFCHNHRAFRNNDDSKNNSNESINEKSKKKVSGPGIEMQWGKMFWDPNNSLGDDGGASRVAWRLVDPIAGSRSSIASLFADDWFLNIEMCSHEMDESVLVERMKSNGMNVGELLIEYEEMMRKLKNNICNGNEDGHEITVVKEEEKEEVEKEVAAEEKVQEKSPDEDEDSSESCGEACEVTLSREQLIKKIMEELPEDKNRYCLGRIKKHNHV